MLNALKRLWSATRTDFIDESLWSPSGWSEAAGPGAAQPARAAASIHDSLRSTLEAAPPAANSDAPAARVA
jgi:hypothetical protein